MAYAFEIGVPMSPTMNQKRALIKAIDRLKGQIIETWSDNTLPYVIKTERLEDMRIALRAAERDAISLMKEEVEGSDGDGHDEEDV
jgi:hypothetical protein